MKPQTSKTNITPKGKAKAIEKQKTGKGKAATTAAAASGKARGAADPPAPPPMNSKKVAKAPAVALKSLEKKVDETEDVTKKAPGKGTKRHAAPLAGSSSSVASKKLRSNAPTGAQKAKPGDKVAAPADAAPPSTPTKKRRVLLKKPSTTLETVKEEAEVEVAATKANAAKAEKPAAKAKKLTPKPTPKNPKKLLLRGKGAASKKKVWQRFIIDCSCLVEDLLMDLADLEKYMKSHIKVNQRINNLGEAVNFERPKNTLLVINSSVHFSKRYFKYLTKRYLKKNSLRDWVRLVSTAKDTFTMRYFKIQDDDNDDDDVINMKE